MNHNKDTQQSLSLKMRLYLIFASIFIQFSLSVALLGFCMHQLKSDNVTSEGKTVYVNLLITIVAYWFPSPINVYLGINEEQKK